jgi:hypothetical protein
MTGTGVSKQNIGLQAPTVKGGDIVQQRVISYEDLFAYNAHNHTKKSKSNQSSLMKLHSIYQKTLFTESIRPKINSMNIKCH